MKKLVYLAAAALLCASCFNVNVNFNGKNAIKGSGPVETRTLDLKDFDAISVVGGADVRFTQADDWEVTVTTQENIFDSLDFVVTDSVLVLQTIGQRTVRAEKYQICISAPDLRKINVTGAADIKSLSAVNFTGDLTVSVSGAAELDFDGLQCGILDLTVNGAADIDIKGLNATAVLVKINGAGDVDLAGKAGEASFEVNGAGDIEAEELSVAGEVRKKTSGAARIRL
ncbi:MAG: DUF2807 domain-containing protein [Bacteroidales bacterium]|jgi:hypothetical protein|nr:DUF2807 domain-containing protein [Bacteroidales bacterium]